MKLTRQHFEAIAGTISKLPEDCTPQQVALAFAVLFQDTNANFNIPRFIKACGIEAN